MKGSAGWAWLLLAVACSTTPKLASVDDWPDLVTVTATAVGDETVLVSFSTRHAALGELQRRDSQPRCLVVRQFGASALAYDGLADAPTRSQIDVPLRPTLPQPDPASTTHVGHFVLGDCKGCTDLKSIVNALAGPLQLHVHAAPCDSPHLSSEHPLRAMLLRPGNLIRLDTDAGTQNLGKPAP